MNTVTPDASSQGMAHSASPLLVGNHSALDFLNSLVSQTGTNVDFLRDGEALLQWMQVSNVLPERTMLAVESFTAAERETLAQELRDLRECFRHLLFKRKASVSGERQSLDARELDKLSNYLAAAPLVEQLFLTNQKAHLVTHRELNQPAAVVAEVAHLVADLLTNYPVEKVRKCENPNCSIWFNDIKRGPPRRWCTRTICGNRAKVAAHRLRQREHQ